MRLAILQRVAGSMAGKEPDAVACGAVRMIDVATDLNTESAWPAPQAGPQRRQTRPQDLDVLVDKGPFEKPGLAGERSGSREPVMDIAGSCRYFLEPREHEEDRAEQIKLDPYLVLARGHAGLAKEHWDFGGRQLDVIPELTRVPDFQRLARQRCSPPSGFRQRREERRGKRKCSAFKAEADIGRAGRAPRIGQTKEGLQDHLQHVVEFWKFFERCFYY